MRKQLIFALVITLLSTSAVRAEDRAGTSDTTTQRRPEIQQISQETRSDVARLHAQRLEKHFGFYYNRLNNIITRFQARLDLLKAAGKDTAAPQAKLDAAKAKLAEAKVKGDEAITAFAAIDPARFAEQRTAAFAARDLAVAARALFQEAHALLKEALRSLKTISKPALPAASAAVQNAL